MSHQDPSSTSPQALQLRSLRIENIRGIESLDLESELPGPPGEGGWTLILGDNGVGKSTILRSLALVLAPRDAAGALLQVLGPAAPFIHHGRDAASITAHFHNNAGKLHSEIHLNRGAEGREQVGHGTAGGDRIYELPAVFAYGCQRGTALGGPERDVDLGRPLDDLLSLFDPTAHLIHAETWLRGLELGALKENGGPREAFFDAVCRTLIGTLVGVDSLEIDKDGRVWLSGERIGRSTLAGLSDGYLTTAGWILDLIARWSHRRRRQGGELDGDFASSMTGFVLIDEIDLHLHPFWQVRIVDDLRRIFPKLSFVATTHNPLSLLGARPGEIFVLSRDPSGLHCTQKDIPPGTRADQVLTGEWFGLPSTVDRETQGLIERHQAMLRDGVPRFDERRQQLENEIRRRIGTFQDTAVDRMVQSVAAEILPDDYPTKSHEERLALREKVLALAKSRGAGA